MEVHSNGEEESREEKGCEEGHEESGKEEDGQKEEIEIWVQGMHERAIGYGWPSCFLGLFSAEKPAASYARRHFSTEGRTLTTGKHRGSWANWHPQENTHTLPQGYRRGDRPDTDRHGHFFVVANGTARCYNKVAHERLHFGAVTAPGEVSLPLPPHAGGSISFLVFIDGPPGNPRPAIETVEIRDIVGHHDKSSELNDLPRRIETIMELEPDGSAVRACS